MNTIKKIGKIYAITGPVGEGLNVPKKYYIGSTKLRLEDRYSLHIIKSFSKNCNSNQELYKLIKEHGKDKFNIKCIEKVFATNEELVKLVGGGDQEPDYKNAAKRKLLQRERHYFEIYKQKYTENVLNKNRPILTDDERENYYNERRDHILNLHKKYYKRDRVNKITYQKSYYKNNKEARKAYQRQYSSANKEAISAKMKEKRKRITCECGSMIWDNQQTQHYRTKKH